LASERVGAAATFLAQAKKAEHFHCAMHCLNLCAAQAVKIPAIQHAQDVIKETVSFFKSSAKRTDMLKSCINEEDDSRISKTQLLSLCTTRFVERHTSVQCFRNLLKYVMQALHVMMEWQSPETRKKAASLINSISQSSFIVSLVVLEELCSVLLPTTRMLQTSGLDVVGAMISIDNVLESLRDMRSAEKFHKLFECISVVAELLQVTLIKLRTAMRSIYRAAAGGADVSVEDYYRINVYYPTIDNIVTDVELRFGPVQKKAATLACLVPGFMKIGTTDDEEWVHVQGLSRSRSLEIAPLRGGVPWPNERCAFLGSEIGD